MSKRKTDLLVFKRAKVQKVDKGSSKNIASTTTSKFEELEHALRQKESNLVIVFLIQEIVKKPADLPLNIKIHLLELCVKLGNEHIIRELLSDQTTNLNTRKGGELLWLAVDEGQAEIAILLVRSGAKLCIREPKDGCTLLHKVLGNFKMKNMASRETLALLLMDSGADINACNSEGFNILQAVMQFDDCSYQIVEEFLNRGVNIRDVCSPNNYQLLNWISVSKPKLLPRLIEYQLSDDENKNLRGTIAIVNLINSKNIEALQIIKKLLEMGVQVNTIVPCGRKITRWCSFLNLALWDKKKDLIKLLVEYGADIHYKDEFGNTPIYQAMRFKGYTIVSRLLLEAGASIHERNDNGRFPIHGACENDSLRNIHLLLNIGANINVTDNEGRTPFASMNKKGLTEASLLVIKHFALIIAKGGTISNHDMDRVNMFSRNFYQKYVAELEKMKVTNICDGISYFSLFSDDVNRKMRLMKRTCFVKNFEQKCKDLDTMFPFYYYMLMYTFQIAKSQYKIFLLKTKPLYEVFEGFLPILVIEKIAYFVDLNAFADFKRCQYDFYMSLHKSLKNNKADKKKILC